MYIATVPNRNSPPAVLLREGWREGNKTRKRTLANLSHSPQPKIAPSAACSRTSPSSLPKLCSPTQKTLPHGHVEAILTAIRKLVLDALISTRRCPERDLVLAMMAQRLLDPSSKLALTQAMACHQLGRGTGRRRGQRK